VCVGEKTKVCRFLRKLNNIPSPPPSLPPSLPPYLQAMVQVPQTELAARGDRGEDGGVGRTPRAGREGGKEGEREEGLRQISWWKVGALILRSLSLLPSLPLSLPTKQRH